MKILLAIDGSPCSDAAVQEVATRPWPAGSQVRILAVAAVPLPDMPDPLLVYYPVRLELSEQARARAQELVERTATGLRDSEGGKPLLIETAVREGSPKTVIIEEAEQWGAELIVVGCHGYGDVKRFLLGSVSQAVAVHAPCSVEIVRRPHQ